MFFIAQQLAQAVVDPAQFLFQPGNMAIDACQIGSGSPGFAVAFADKHFQQLPPAGNHNLQLLRFFRLHRAGLRANRFREKSEQLGVNRVSLGQLARSLCKIPGLARVDPGGPKALADSAANTADSNPPVASRTTSIGFHFLHLRHSASIPSISFEN